MTITLSQVATWSSPNWPAVGLRGDLGAEVHHAAFEPKARPGSVDTAHRADHGVEVERVNESPAASL